MSDFNIRKFLTENDQDEYQGPYMPEHIAQDMIDAGMTATSEQNLHDLYAEYMGRNNDPETMYDEGLKAAVFAAYKKIIKNKRKSGSDFNTLESGGDRFDDMEFGDSGISSVPADLVAGIKDHEPNAPDEAIVSWYHSALEDGDDINPEEFMDWLEYDGMDDGMFKEAAEDPSRSPTDEEYATAVHLLATKSTAKLGSIGVDVNTGVINVQDENGDEYEIDDGEIHFTNSEFPESVQTEAAMELPESKLDEMGVLLANCGIQSTLVETAKQGKAPAAQLKGKNKIKNKGVKGYDDAHPASGRLVGEAGYYADPGHWGRDGPPEDDELDDDGFSTEKGWGHEDPVSNKIEAMKQNGDNGDYDGFWDIWWSEGGREEFVELYGEDNAYEIDSLTKEYNEDSAAYAAAQMIKRLEIKYASENEQADTDIRKMQDDAGVIQEIERDDEVDSKEDIFRQAMGWRDEDDVYGMGGQDVPQQPKDYDVKLNDDDDLTDAPYNDFDADYEDTLAGNDPRKDDWKMRDDEEGLEEKLLKELGEWDDTEETRDEYEMRTGDYDNDYDNPMGDHDYDGDESVTIRGELPEKNYWDKTGKLQKESEALEELLPTQGEVEDYENNPELEKFRRLANIYYDVYNNGSWDTGNGQRGDEMEEVFNLGPGHTIDADDLEEMVDEVTQAAWDEQLGKGMVSEEFLHEEVRDTSFGIDPNPDLPDADLREPDGLDHWGRPPENPEHGMTEDDEDFGVGDVDMGDDIVVAAGDLVQVDSKLGGEATVVAQREGYIVVKLPKGGMKLLRDDEWWLEDDPFADTDGDDDVADYEDEEALQFEDEAGHPLPNKNDGYDEDEEHSTYKAGFQMGKSGAQYPKWASKNYGSDEPLFGKGHAAGKKTAGPKRRSTAFEDQAQVMPQHSQDDRQNHFFGEGYTILPPIDPKYVERDGLEGPFRLRSGKVYYYDPRAGKNYDPDTDFYMSDEEWFAHDADPKQIKPEYKAPEPAAEPSRERGRMDENVVFEPYEKKASGPIERGMKKGAKWVKRGFQWGSDESPDDMVKRHQEYSTDSLKNLQDKPGTWKTGPAKLQQKLINRNLRKRGERDFDKYMDEAGHYQDYDHSIEKDKAHFKRSEMQHELGHEDRLNNWGIFIDGKLWKAVENERHASAIVNTLTKKGKDASYKLGVYPLSEGGINEYDYPKNIKNKGAAYKQYAGDSTKGAKNRKSRKAFRKAEKKKKHQAMMRGEKWAQEKVPEGVVEGTENFNKWSVKKLEAWLERHDSDEPGMAPVFGAQLKSARKALQQKRKSVKEGGMPSGVIKAKVRYQEMTDEEFAAQFGERTEENLRQMAWRHGYGKMSSHYWNRVQRVQGIEEAWAPWDSEHNDDGSFVDDESGQILPGDQMTKDAESGEYREKTQQERLGPAGWAKLQAEIKADSEEWERELASWDDEEPELKKVGWDAIGDFGDVAGGGGDPIDFIMQKYGFSMDDIDAEARNQGYEDGHDWADSYQGDRGADLGIDNSDIPDDGFSEGKSTHKKGYKSKGGDYTRPGSPKNARAGAKYDRKQAKKELASEGLRGRVTSIPKTSDNMLNTTGKIQVLGPRKDYAFDSEQEAKMFFGSAWRQMQTHSDWRIIYPSEEVNEFDSATLSTDDMRQDAGQDRELGNPVEPVEVDADAELAGMQELIKNVIGNPDQDMEDAIQTMANPEDQDIEQLGNDEVMQLKNLLQMFK